MKKIIKLIVLQLLSVLRRPVWWILLAFGAVFSLGCFIYSYSKEPFLAVSQMAYGQAVITITLMMIGIEMRREQRNEFLDDIYTAYRYRLTTIPVVQIISVVFISFFLTLLIGTGCGITMAADSAPWIWIFQNLLMIVLFYFLPCVISGLWGLLVSELIKGKSVFLPALLVWFLTSSLCSYITEMISSVGTIGGKAVFNFFNMGLNSFHMYRNINTGAEIELPRWIVRLGILLIVGVLYIIFYRNARKTGIRWRKVRYVVPIMAAVILLTVLYIRYNVFFSRFSDPTDVMDYVLYKSDLYMQDEKVEPDTFPKEINLTVKKTNINLRCDCTGMHTEVTMTAVQQNDSRNQAFTLYSDLIVDRVTVNGCDVDFERSNDDLLVVYRDNIKSGENVEIQFAYHGYSLPSFPANETTVQLNRAFPWIPWPGIRTTTSYNNELYSETERFFISDSQRGYEVEYSLSYEGPGNIYCNLEKQGNGSWTGISDSGVSIYSGMIHETNDGINVYMPASQYRFMNIPGKAVSEAFDLVKSLSERLDTEKEPLYPDTVVLIQMRVPVVGSCPQELYFWGDEWEIRARNEASAILGAKSKAGEDADAYIRSKELRRVAVSAMLSTAAGFPCDISSISTEFFAQLYDYYILVSSENAEQNENARENIISLLTGGSWGMHEGKLVEETPFTEDESEMLSEILDKMEENVDYDEAFRQIYLQLTLKKYVTAREMLKVLADR